MGRNERENCGRNEKKKSDGEIKERIKEKLKKLFE